MQKSACSFVVMLNMSFAVSVSNHDASITTLIISAVSSCVQEISVVSRFAT